MRRLSFLEDEPWDEAEDATRTRWFGHPFGTDHLGASLIEYLPQAPGVRCTCTTGSRRCSSSSVGR